MVQSLWISRLNAATSTLPDKRSVVYVVDRMQGNPVADATVRLFEQHYQPTTRLWEKRLVNETKLISRYAYFSLERHMGLNNPVSDHI